MAPSVPIAVRPPCRRPQGPFALCRGTRRAAPGLCRATEAESAARQRWPPAPSGTVGRMTAAWRSGIAWLRAAPDGGGRRAGAGASASRRWSRVYTTFELLRQDPAFDEPGKGWIVVALLAVTLPLAFRRRYPLLVAVVVTGAFVVGRVLVNPGLPVPGGVGGRRHRLGRAGSRSTARSRTARDRARRSRVVAAVVLVVLGEVVREIFFYEGGIYDGLPLNEAFLLAYNVVVGRAARRCSAWPSARCASASGELAAQAAELRREREENARRAVLDERVRIARELHDVVAHHVSVMGVQAGAARRVMAPAAGPGRGGARPRSRPRAGRPSLELQRLLGFLRREGQDDELAPQPDLAQLPELVAQAGGDDLAVELRGRGRAAAAARHARALRLPRDPGGAHQHPQALARGTAATVRVAYGPAALEVEVRRRRRAAAPAPAGGGHGLIGMRERVRLHGGHLRAGPRPGGGFAVHATFPLNGRPRVTIRVVLADDQAHGARRASG